MKPETFAAFCAVEIQADAHCAGYNTWTTSQGTGSDPDD